jgi:hypothetical protein
MIRLEDAELNSSQPASDELPRLCLCPGIVRQSYAETADMRIVSDNWCAIAYRHAHLFSLNQMLCLAPRAA